MWSSLVRTLSLSLCLTGSCATPLAAQAAGDAQRPAREPSERLAATVTLDRDSGMVASVRKVFICEPTTEAATMNYARFPAFDRSDSCRSG